MYRSNSCSIYGICSYCLLDMKLKKITKLKLMVASVTLIGAPIIMIVVSVLSHNQTTCIFDALGFKCLGCNILGALHKLKQGQFVEAFYQNPLIYIWLGLGGCILISELYTLVKRIIDRTYKHDSLLEWLLKKMFKGILL